MNKRLVFLVIMVCLFAFVVVLAFAQNSPTVRWEYTSSWYNDFRSIDDANRLGVEGWELVTSVGNDLIFKRRLP